LRQSSCAKFRTLQRAQAVSNYFGMIVNWPPIKMQITKRSYEQALRGALAARREKEGQLATTFLEYLISASKKSMRNADWWRWHKKWRHYPQHVFLNVCLHSRSFPLRADWEKSDSSVDGDPQGDWSWNSNSTDVVASSPSFSHPAPRPPWRACSQVSDSPVEIPQPSVEVSVTRKS